MALFLPIIPLLLLALLPLQTDKEVIIKPGISLEEARQVRFPVKEWKTTPVTPAWQELLSQAKEAGWQGKTNGKLSGVRRHEDQKKLYNLFLEGRGAPAFPPSGPSRHLLRNIQYWGQWSQAVDVSRPKELIAKARRLGVALHAPYAPEPWHVEARYVFSLPGEEIVTEQKEPLIPLSIPIAAAFVVALYLIYRRRMSVLDRQIKRRAGKSSQAK